MRRLLVGTRAAFLTVWVALPAVCAVSFASAVGVAAAQTEGDLDGFTPGHAALQRQYGVSSRG